MTHTHNTIAHMLHWTIISCILTVGVVQGMQLFASALVLNRKPATGIAVAAKSRQVHPAASDTVPSFECAIDPFGRVPNWGGMQSAAQLNRAYASIAPQEYVPPPAYDIRDLAGEALDAAGAVAVAAAAERILSKAASSVLIAFRSLDSRDGAALVMRRSG